MEFAEVVRRRRMVRDYDPDRPLPAGLLDRVVDVALRAPTAGFTQGVSFLILTDARDRELFWSATTDDGAPDGWLRGMQRAPGLILVLTSADAYLDRYAQPDKGWTRPSGADAASSPDTGGPWTAPYWFVDAGMAAMALLYAVVDTGGDLGGCFFGVPADRVQGVRDRFGIPADQACAGVISVGYRATDERQSGSPRKRNRLPRTELVHHHRWKGRSGD